MADRHSISTDKKTLRIQAPHFVAGVDVNPQTGVVVQAAPICRYMVGWSEDRVRAYCATKRYGIVELPVIEIED